MSTVSLLLNDYPSYTANGFTAYQAAGGMESTFAFKRHPTLDTVFYMAGVYGVNALQVQNGAVTRVERILTYTGHDFFFGLDVRAEGSGLHLVAIERSGLSSTQAILHEYTVGSDGFGATFVRSLSLPSLPRSGVPNLRPGASPTARSGDQLGTVAFDPRDGAAWIVGGVDGVLFRYKDGIFSQNGYSLANGVSSDDGLDVLFFNNYGGGRLHVDSTGSVLVAGADVSDAVQPGIRELQVGTDGSITPGTFWRPGPTGLAAGHSEVSGLTRTVDGSIYYSTEVDKDPYNGDRPPEERTLYRLNRTTGLGEPVPIDSPLPHTGAVLDNVPGPYGGFGETDFVLFESLAASGNTVYVQSEFRLYSYMFDAPVVHRWLIGAVGFAT